MNNYNPTTNLCISSRTIGRDLIDFQSISISSHAEFVILNANSRTKSPEEITSFKKVRLFNSTSVTLGVFLFSHRHTIVTVFHFFSPKLNVTIQVLYSPRTRHSQILRGKRFQRTVKELGFEA